MILWSEPLRYIHCNPERMAPPSAPVDSCGVRLETHRCCQGVFCRLGCPGSQPTQEALQAGGHYTLPIGGPLEGIGTSKFVWGWRSRSRPMRRREAAAGGWCWRSCRSWTWCNAYRGCNSGSHSGQGSRALINHHRHILARSQRSFPITLTLTN